MFENVTDTWEGIVANGGQGQRLIDGHSLRLYFGADAASRPVFFLITNKKPQIPRMSTLVTVDRGERKDGTWTVVLTLQEKGLTPAFMGMCIELVRRSSGEPDESKALDVFFSTLNQWRSLLSHKPPQRLSNEELRGLVAEIWFASEFLQASNSGPEVMAAWQGPYGAPQDFRLPSGQMFEVKALHAGARAFDVSSVEQLDPTVEGPLTLSAVLLDDSVGTTPGSFTILTLIELLRTTLAGDAEALDGLEHRLEALGFDSSDDFYGNHFFTVSGLRLFSVTDEFPRLLRTHAPIAVEQIKYRVRIAGLAHLEVSLDEVGLTRK